MSTKICSKCKEDKPLTEFTSHRAYYCDSCKDPDYNKKYAKEYYQKNKERMRVSIAASQAKEDPIRRKERLKQSTYLRKYGITPEQADELLQSQGGVCVICKTVPIKPSVDHCHNTGRIRGILCHSCNVGLGHFRDDIELLLAACDYLEA